ncbi:MAG: hypothetical protein GY790_13210 [Bacteroidetes bacterium]|nr:hypothetical protein [Bacteroidota bacterium]
MKKIVIISLALALSFSAFSQTSGTGIGVSIGTNVDFTAKFWTGETSAFAVAAGVDFRGYWGGIHVSGDYLFHLWSFDVGQDMMKVYFGPGVGVGFSFRDYDHYYSEFWDGYDNYSRIWLTVRAPGGVAYYFHKMPFECFVEFVPGLDIFGPGGFDDRWASYVGARWYF